MPSGEHLNFEASNIGGEQQIVDLNKSFPAQELKNAIEGAVELLEETIKKVKPDKATVKFGVKMAVESGQLTALIVKGSGEANLEITFEWGK